MPKFSERSVDINELWVLKWIFLKSPLRQLVHVGLNVTKHGMSVYQDVLQISSSGKNGTES